MREYSEVLPTKAPRPTETITACLAETTTPDVKEFRIGIVIVSYLSTSVKAHNVDNNGNVPHAQSTARHDYYILP